MGLFKFGISKNKWKTICKCTYLRAFFDIEANLAFKIAVAKQSKRYADENPEIDIFQKRYEESKLVLPDAQAKRRAFIFESQTLRNGPYDVNFDAFLKAFVLSDSKNCDILYKYFKDNDNIKKFVDMFFIDSLAYGFATKKGMSDKEVMPFSYAIFLTDDKTFLERICDLYSKYNLKINIDEGTEIMNEFKDYCLDESKLRWSDVFFALI